MNTSIKNHHAFTLLEMVFVITILGIVAAISSEVIAKSYESYINQRALYRASTKTELVATQIANRLAYAMPGSIVARNDNDVNLNAIVGIKDLLPNNNFRALQWIGYDRDGFTSRDAGANPVDRRPAWNGFADLSMTVRVPGTNNVNVSTPGSNLDLATGQGLIGNGIIPNLSTIGVGRTLAGSALYTPVDGLTMYNAGGYTLAGNQGIYVVNGQIAGNKQAFQINIPLLVPATMEIAEQYKLAWTSYAIVPTPVVNGTFNLFLHFNFQPWNGDNYQAVADGGQAQRKLLLRNVTVFRFTGSDSALRFKLCQRERTGGTLANPTFVTICKEKVVIK